MVCQKYGQKYGQKYLQRYRLRYSLLWLVCLMAVPAHGHMGRSLPIGYTGEGSVHLAAQVIASYFEEQMGRETKLVEAGSLAKCLQSVRDREFPMAVVNYAEARELPDGVIKLEVTLGAPGRSVVFVIGSDARKKLEFSLVPGYLNRLSRSLAPTDWEKALTRVEAGEGVRGVALEMLRERDLL
jgi:hypothetical protein